MSARQISGFATGFAAALLMLSMSSASAQLTYRAPTDAAVDVGRFRLSMDAAWIPYRYFTGTDAHWLRIGTTLGAFMGPVPATGTGWGYQLEAILSYRYNNSLSLGLGSRYWQMQSGALVHFDGHVVGVNAVAQRADFQSDNYASSCRRIFTPAPIRCS